ncbi:MAG: hypothetical protein HYY02_08805 [Chloroflexi bacterium]|nr:hypothetical protein [Chloroflexota bacterium]
MIVRISTEGQYRLRSAQLDRLNRLDNQVVEAVAKGSERRFRTAYDRMLDFVRQKGEAVPVAELVESDLVLPQPDLTLQEAQRLFVGEGLLPG